MPKAKLSSPFGLDAAAQAAKSKSSIWPEPSAPSGADNFAFGEVTSIKDSRRGTQVLIPSRNRKRFLCGNPHAPAEPVHVIEIGTNRNT